MRLQFEVLGVSSQHALDRLLANIVLSNILGFSELRFAERSE